VTGPTDAEIVHRPERSRYELLVGGSRRGVAEYRLDADDGRVVFTHTEVDVPLRGLGYSDALVRAALDDVRASGGRARAQCWFVRDYAREHPEYTELFR
jgi:predicted GNAT family acetyltransferase